jgi:selenocysteine lyase/cysteine desulfurase
VPFLDRRGFLGALSAPAAAALAPAWLCGDATARARAAFAGLEDARPDQVAGLEAPWLELSQAFSVDRSAINLNNGGVSPAPRVVQEAHKRHLDFSNQLPTHNLWSVLDPQVEGVRAGLAETFGCDAEEIAITRNASESLETCLLGLDLERGDEIVASDQEYPRMLATLRQREAREGLVWRSLALPPADAPDEQVVRAYEEALTPRTRLMLVSHVIYLSGRILPVRELVALGRSRGIPVVVDGAHAFAHVVFRRDDLDCDYYGSSLHKWLFAPHGTGLLHVRRERIAGLWPLMAADAGLADDVRKFEQIGTHPAAGYVAVAEALAFHRAIGAERKAARLAWLRDLWADRLLATGRAHLWTSREPGRSCGIATVRFDGLDAGELREHLWRDHRILTTAIEHPAVRGLRVSPSVYTLPEEIERFCTVVERALQRGIPR